MNSADQPGYDFISDLVPGQTEVFIRQVSKQLDRVGFSAALSTIYQFSDTFDTGYCHIVINTIFIPLSEDGRGLLRANALAVFNMAKSGATNSFHGTHSFFPIFYNFYKSAILIPIYSIAFWYSLR